MTAGQETHRLPPARGSTSSGLEALASDLCLEGSADRLIEAGRVLGGLLLAFLLEERITLLGEFEDLAADFLALLDLVRDDLLPLLGRELLELVGQLVGLQGVQFDCPVLDALDQVVVVVGRGVDRLVVRTSAWAAAGAASGDLLFESASELRPCALRKSAPPIPPIIPPP